MSKFKKRDLERKGDKKQKIKEDKLIGEHIEDFKKASKDIVEVEEE